ncbi:MAG: helix-turn-helix domain-containing protein [Candidatus Omnitrophota bacterium]
MEAKLLKDPDNRCDYVLISADEQSLSYLNQGSPLRVGFFTDNNEGLPQYKRKSMVVIIGKDLDFSRHNIYKEGFFKKGLVDKSYLIEYIQKMKKKLIQMAMQELEVLDLPGESIDTKAIIENIEESPEAITEPGEYIHAAQAAEILSIAASTMANLAKKGLIKGEHNGFSWTFIKSDIENLIKEQPDFLTKIWKHCRNITKGRQYDKEIIKGEDKYIHIRKAKVLLALSENTIKKYAKAGLIQCIKENHKKYYISIKHIEQLRANPPAWLKKSWSYFAKNRVE